MAASEATASSKGRSNASSAFVGVRRDGFAVTSSTPRQRVEPASGRSRHSPPEAPISREAMTSRLWNTALALSRSVMVNAGTGGSLSHWKTCRDSRSSGSRNTAPPPACCPMNLTVSATTWPGSTEPASAFASEYRARVRPSLATASSVLDLSPAVRWLMKRATASMTAKVTRYCASLTARDICGGTKKKSNSTTLAKLARIAGGRPRNAATSTTVSRNSMTVLARSSVPCRGHATAAVSTHAASASRWRIGVDTVGDGAGIIERLPVCMLRSLARAAKKRRIISALGHKRGVNGQGRRVGSGSLRSRG